MESLLKNLNLDGRKSDKPAEHAATPPPSAVPGPAHDGGVGGLLGKFGSALESHLNQGSSAPPVAHPAPVPQQAVRGEGLFDKISDAIGGNHQTQAPAPPPPAPVPQSTEQKIFGKISDALGRKTTPPPPPPPAPAPKKEGVEGVFDKIGDVLGRKSTPPPPPPPAPKKEGVEAVFDKLGDVLSGKKPTQTAPPPEPKKTGIEGMFDKIGDKITGKDEPPPPPPSFIHKVSEVFVNKKDEASQKPTSIGDKINHALGGGSKGEAQEGRLDKAIDLVQEYVLKEGPQHHESAFEQAKDKKIADTIRNTLGMEKKKD